MRDRGWSSKFRGFLNFGGGWRRKGGGGWEWRLADRECGLLGSFGGGEELRGMDDAD